ncbi:ATP-binding protein [uncultured Hymenobacter sp.]|uniref:sensor histidine kinase n=1 Tax=uncultured Hymenobacter sp. TaxID=170016 RepID=UPI0035C9DBDD
MSLKLKIRLSILALLLLLLGLGTYAFFAIEYLQAGAHGIEAADFQAARQTVLAFVSLGTVLGLILAVRLPRIVVRPLRRLSADVARVAGPGPATRVAVTRDDEVGSVAAAVNQVLAQAQDARRVTLAELIVQRDRMETLVQSLDEGLLLIDQQGFILLANPVACQLLGEDADKLLGQPAANVAARNELLRQFLVPVNTPHPSTATLQGPLFAVPSHGGERHFQLTVSHILSLNEDTARQESAGHILCLRNVSDFKRLDQLKSTFLATISHELKTPLASINLSLMLLRDERTPADERQRLAAGIGEETQRLLRMVGQLIEVARLDAGGRPELRLQPVKLAEVVGYALDTVQPQLTDKQLQVELNLPPELPAVQADLEKTTWVLINLLSNAIRYSPPGGKLCLRALPWGEMVRLAVQDQGPGIAPQYHKRVFQRFADVPKQAGYGGGSGLGLSISHDFITAHGGQLWVESQPPNGSCFLFTLPVAQ